VDYDFILLFDIRSAAKFTSGHGTDEIKVETLSATSSPHPLDGTWLLVLGNARLMIR
jgi:hypothetical protein